MTNPAIGDQAACAACGRPIVWIGERWDHVGDLKPRHIAQPAERPVDFPPADGEPFPEHVTRCYARIHRLTAERDAALATLELARLRYVELEAQYDARGPRGYYWQRAAAALLPTMASSRQADALADLVRHVGLWARAEQTGDSVRAIAAAALCDAWDFYTRVTDASAE